MMMTKQETREMLSILKAAYPHSFKDMTLPDASAMLNLWSMMFESDDKNEVYAAVQALIATRTEGFSPTVGEVKEQMQKLKKHDELDELSAWALVSKACSNGLYGYKEEFAKLPPDVQNAVGSPEQLRDWAMMDVDTVQSVVASNFQRNYRTSVKRQKEFAKLPPNVQQMITGIADRLMLEGKENQ